MRAWLLALALGAGVLLAPHPALAVDCGRGLTSSPELERIDATARVAFIQRSLDRASRASKIWTGTWAGVFSALSIGGAVLAPLSPSEERPDYYFTTGKSLIGTEHAKQVRRLLPYL